MELDGDKDKERDKLVVFPSRLLE